MRKVVCVICAEAALICGGVVVAVIEAAVPLWVWVAGLAFSIALPPVLYWREILQYLAGRFLNITPQSDDPGYDVIVWWGETGNPLEDAMYRIFNRKRFPKTIRDKRTGLVQEVAHPSSRKSH